MATTNNRVPGIRSVPDNLGNEELRDYLGDVHRLLREVRSSGLLTGQLSAGGAGTTTIITTPPPPPAPGDPPDLTPPPTPTGLTATAGFANIFIEWDVAVYTQGHGNLQTNIYGAKYTSGPLPTFSDTVLVGSAPQPDAIYILPTELNTQWHIWIKFQSKDGVESVSPAGGANGAQATTGAIGTTDLGPLIVEAGNLATGAVTATKLAAGAVGLTAFAAGLEPVSIVGALPSPAGYTGARTVFLTTDSKLYRYTGSAWVATTPAADITGTLSDAQLAAISAAKITGQITSTQITDGAISTPKLAAGAVTAATIAADTITAAQIAASAITATELAAGSVTTAKLVVGAVTANELAANSVVAGKIAAGAVSADQIAANAIRAHHLLIVPRSLNPDPTFASGSLSWAGFVQRLGASAPGAPPGAPQPFVAEFSGRDNYGLQPIPVKPGEQYKVSFWAYRNGSGGSGIAPEVVWFNTTSVLITGQIVGAFVSADGWQYISGVITVPETTGGQVVAGIAPAFYADKPAFVGTYWITDLNIEKVNDASLIVDGSIVASKLAANSIAVGTAAIENGAIVNAMIADATIDSAKIATLSAGKITAGSLGVGAFIQSNDYVSGVAGWRISGSGFAELDSVSIRGNFSASRISAGNIQSGGYIRSTSYTPGVIGWSINADGTAEFEATSIRGVLSAGNIIGEAATTSRNGNSVTLTGGAVQNYSFVSPSGMTLESHPSTNIAYVEGEFIGDFALRTNVSFAGGGGTYKMDLTLRPAFDVWNGSTWVQIAYDNDVQYSSTVVLTGDEVFRIPIAIKERAQIDTGTYSQVRVRVDVTFAGFKQLVVNGGSIKTDVLNSASWVGKFMLRQSGA